MSENHIRRIAARLRTGEAQALQFCVSVQKHFTSSEPPSFKVIAAFLDQHGHLPASPEDIAQQIRAARAQRSKRRSRSQDGVIGRSPSRESDVFTPLIAHDPRPYTEDFDKCPHGILKFKKCAICDPEGFRLEHGWD